MKSAALFLPALALQIPVLIGLAMANANAMNPDGAVYIRLADYYLRGEFHLAVSGYWGPLLSWLIMPFRLLEGQHSLAARAAIAISAIIFLMGGSRILIVSGLPRLATIAGSILVALFAAKWSVAVISPDLLAGGLLLLGLSFLLDPGESGAGHRPVAAGVLLGIAYYAKAVSLPLGLGIVLLLAFVRTAIGAAPRAQAIRSVSRSVLALLLVALPWIVILSLHYGRPTFSTSGRMNYVPARAERLPPGIKQRWAADLSFLTLHTPKSGRIASWEDPSELRHENSALDNGWAVTFLPTLRRTVKSAAKVLEVIKPWDLLGLGVACMILGFLFHLPWGEGFRRDPWRLSLCIVAPLIALYAVVALDAPRYFLLVYPLLVASAVGLCLYLARSAARQRRPEDSLWPAGVVQWLTVTLVFASFAYPLAFDLRDAFHGASNQSQYGLARDLASELGPGPEAIAEVGARSYVGYYTAFLTGRPWHGRSIANPGVDELIASGAEIFVVPRESDTDELLKADERAEPLAAFPTPVSRRSVVGWPWRVYRLVADDG